MNDLLTVVVVSFDGYSDLWDDFFELKAQNWPDCPFDTVLITNTKTPVYNDVRVIHTGLDLAWSQRVRQALEQVKTPYVCLLLDDFYLSGQIDNDVFYKIVQFIRAENIAYYKLDTTIPIRTARYKDLEYLRIIDVNLRYGISLLAAIWDKEFLISLLEKSACDAWQFEIDRNKGLLNGEFDPNRRYVYDNRDVLRICQLVIQGKCNPDAIRTLQKNGFRITTSRTVMTRKELIRYKFRLFCSRLTFAGTLLKFIGKALGYKFAPY